ncbi:MAG: VOC family protein [Pirellulales bacterium]|nr:VOC family protein [Pirellulales bacterium]
MSQNSAVAFAGMARIHVGLGVSDIDAAVRFYECLLQSSPVKRRPGYAKFEPESPSVNLSLYEAADAAKRASTHYGVQVKSTDAVREAATRLKSAGVPIREEFQSACCCAVQDKIWVTDPDGHRWEVFVVTGAEAPNLSPQPVNCCADATSDCC